MKIGIVTIIDYTNYGNRLQNYAVHHILKEKIGIEAITLVPNKEKPFFDGNYILWMKNCVVKMFHRFPKLIEKRFGPVVTRGINFQKWSKLIPTETYYECEKLPQTINERYDFFVAGSDQIWNYNFSNNRFEDYFLKFTDAKKRIAISASFGINNIPKEWEKPYIDGLNGFANISVREMAGQTIIRDLLNREVPVLIDPVMMLNKEEWLKVSKKPRVDCSKPYVLKYYLGDKVEDDLVIWARDKGYEIYELLDESIPELYSAGPGEFISLINNASLICSDSFHCIAFSIIFTKPFVVYSRQGEESDMTSRLDTLLEKFGFQNRWKHLTSEKEYLICDYSSADEQMQKEQKEFVNYILKALKLED